jgi:N-acyl homoserine lactone hydrolase
VLATPSNTLGHQSVALDTAEGLIILAGQACYTAGEWAGDPEALEGRSTASDPAAYDRSIERLRALRPARVLFGHDRDPWAAGPRPVSPFP